VGSGINSAHQVIIMASTDPKVVLRYTQQILESLKTTQNGTPDAPEPAAEGDIEI